MDQLKKLSIILPPGLLAALEFFHASGHGNAVYATLAPQIDRWMIVHYLQLVLFPLTAWSVYALSQYVVERQTRTTGNSASRATAISKLIAVTMAIYGIGFASFDSIAGIGTGILIQDSLEMIEILKTSPVAPESFQPITSEMVQSYYHAPGVRSIFHIAMSAAIVGFALTAYRLHRYNYGTFPVLMLVGACYGVTQTHAPPYGPITYGFIFAASVFAIYLKKSSSSDGRLSADKES